MKDKDWLLLAGLSASALIGGLAIMYYGKPYVDQFVASLANPKQNPNPEPKANIPEDNPGHVRASPGPRNSSFHSFVEAGKNPYFRTVELLRPRFTYDKGKADTTPIKGRLKGKYQQ